MSIVFQAPLIHSCRDPHFAQFFLNSIWTLLWSTVNVGLSKFFYSSHSIFIFDLLNNENLYDNIIFKFQNHLAHQMQLTLISVSLIPYIEHCTHTSPKKLSAEKLFEKVWKAARPKLPGDTFLWEGKVQYFFPPVITKIIKFSNQDKFTWTVSDAWNSDLFATQFSPSSVNFREV